MVTRLFFSTLVVSSLIIGGQDGFAKAPIAIETVATVEELEAEITAQLAAIEEIVTAGKYEEKTEEAKQAAGVIAVLSQGLAEHPDHAKSKINGPAARDAAMAAADKKADAELFSGKLEELKKSLAGETSGDHAQEHPWNKLIRMHAMMEEINARNSKLRRALRRPKGEMDERLHAVTSAMLTVAMHADTHEVKDKTRVPEWEQLCVDYLTSLNDLSKSLGEKDADGAAKHYEAANQACDKCHELFRDE